MLYRVFVAQSPSPFCRMQKERITVGTAFVLELIAESEKFLILG